MLRTLSLPIMNVLEH